MSRAAYATIDLAALKHNFSIAAQAAPSSKIMAVIKANAYGHGMLDVADALCDADAFAVAHFEEAVSLREANIPQRIVVLQGFADEVESALLISQDVEPVIHCLDQITILEKMTLNEPVNVWLKIDTGMHRIGIIPEQFNEAWQRLQAIKAITGNISLMTHFANSDDVESASTAHQMALFTKTVNHAEADKSLANSGGLLHWPESHADWIRPGIMLYGASPFINKTASQLKLQAVMTLKSRLIAVNPLKKGESVGYGSSWTAERDTLLGVIGIGYGDGYPRHVASDTPVLIDGRRYPIVGRVSMDMVCVDLGHDSQVEMGDEVILWGNDLPADLIAEKAGTIAYELFCQVTSRVRFETING